MNIFKVKRRLFFVLLFIISAVLSFYFFTEKGGITILYTTDLQGFITPHKYFWPDIKGNPLVGGSSYMATYVNQERISAKRRNNAFLLLDTGNFFSGQAEGYFFSGLSVIGIMNKLGYDAMTIGPKDFAFGEKNLRKLSKEAKFPFLGANVVEENRDEVVDYLRPYIINDYKGIKMGIIGIVSPIIFLENTKGIRVLDPISTANKYVSLLKNAGVNAVVILSSLGLEEDKRLAYEVKGINIIIGGNDHEGWRILWPFYVDSKNKTVIVETWQKGNIGYRLDLILDKKGKIIKFRPKWTDLLIAKFKPNLEVYTIVQKYIEAVKEKKKEIVGYVETPLIKDKESTLGNWIADILCNKTKVDIALVAGLRSDLEEGTTTLGDVYNVLPIIDELDTVGFNLAILELTGEQIKEILEIGVSYGLEKEEGIVQVSGLKYTYNLKRKKWDRIVDVTVNGEKLHLSRAYNVAVNGYLAAGLGGYTTIQNAKKRIDTGLMDFDVLAEYIKAHSPITAPPLEGRIVAVE